MHHAVENFASHTDMRALALVGGVGPKAQIAALSEGAEVVVATPGRFMELYLKGRWWSTNCRPWCWTKPTG